MSRVAACAWPASVASSHPGSQKGGCPLFRPRLYYSTVRHQVSLQKRPSRSSSSAKQPPQAVAPQGAVRDQSTQRQQAAASNHALTRGSLNVADDPQGSIPDQAGNSAPQTTPSGQTSVPTTSTYTKADRANLASIPESEMTPEMLRRWRISKANKGKQPWNKGRQHPPGNVHASYTQQLSSQHESFGTADIVPAYL